jgi:hypothetical protein
MKKPILIEDYAVSRLEDLYNRIQEKGIGFDRFEFHGDFAGEDSKGTFGCILGALPYLYPDIFEFVTKERKNSSNVSTFVNTDIPRLISGERSLFSYFGVNSDIMAHLFMPGKQIKSITTQELQFSSTLKETMDNLKLTIEYLKTNNQ